MKKLILRNFLIVLILTFATSLSLFAEGSKDLFPDLCPGYRAMLSSSNTAPVNYAHIVNHGKMFVYAKNGEMIYIGSSALGHADSVRVTDPNGVVSIHTGIVGRINDRTQELIGPATLNVGGYNPIVKSVTSSNQGVWIVEFLSSNPNADLDGAVSNHNLLANASWDTITQPLASSYILAWDITVANGATAIPGRVFMNVFTGSVGGGSTHSLYSSFYVLTNDGYRYKFSCNGLEPWAFAFFSNNKGLENSITGLPVFISAANANIVNNSGPGKTYSFKDPTSPDDASNITHKLFYNAPSPDMPTTATGFQNGSSQQFWLYNTPKLATATNIDVTGIEGASFLGTGALAGAIISFTTNSACRYEILIDADNNGLFTDAVDIKLAGDASAGLNKVYWDGKDGNGVVLSSSNTIKVKVNVFSAEVHFPLIDAETNLNGIKLQQMIDNDSTIYWNDTPLGVGGSNHSSIGVNSSKGAHNWSTNFGDIVTIDTWAYSLNPSATFTKLIQRQETDLETVSISKVPTILCSGGNVTYTVVVRNNGPDNATGAKFKFSVPARMIVNSVYSVVTGTGSSVSTSLPGSVYDATVNLNNGSTITYTISASDTGGASVTATAKASMLRATNVTDPDATNPDSAVPTDPDDECNASPSGVGCNNIKTTDLIISNSAPTFTVFASPTTCANTLVTYTTQSSQSNYVWTLSGTAGVDYQITSGGVGISSNSVTLKWLTSGNKTVSVSYDGSCSGGSATSTTNVVSLPSVYNVTGGGSYCSGSVNPGFTIGLSGSQTGVSYQLYNGASPLGSALTGTGSSISFGLQTSVGTYTVVATNTSTCSQTMSGSATITMNTLPTLYNVTGGGSYCSGGSGVSIGLSSSQTGVSYQLYNGVSPVGASVLGNGSAISFGLQTSAGIYTVIATNVNTCSQIMNGSATVTINALPTTYTVTGGGSYCSGGSGLAIGLNGSQVGVNYQLYKGASPIGSSVSGTGSAISFGLQTSIGTYTVVATNGSGCTQTMSGSAIITINSLPVSYVVSGGGSYCAGSGGLGLGISLSGSELGVSYRLYNGASLVGGSVSGTGSALSFGNYLPAGTYTVIATNGSGCTQTMSGSAVITINSLPTAYTVIGGGSYCAGSGGSGLAIGLSNSELGVSYRLYQGAVAVGSSVSGTGSAISFGSYLSAGTYTVLATNGSGCSQTMTGSASIIINSLPSSYTVTGGGSYCAGSGGLGLAIGLSSSDLGVSYRLYQGGVAVGSSVSGTGSAISFGSYLSAGTYTVLATNGSGCTQSMSGSAVITINSLPTAYTVTGGGSYCSGGLGVPIGLSSSQIGVSYQLYNGLSPVGSSVSGTGSAINFGLQTSAGTYSVVATNSSTCSQMMSGNATITVNPLPTAYTVIGGGSYCVGGSGVAIGLSSSDLGVSYQLYNGASSIGLSVSGTGSAISFGIYLPAGTYTVIATNGSGCTQTMSGSALISINSLPTAYTVIGGGSYCAGSGGSGLAIGLSNSELGVSYRLYNGVNLVGGAISGTGSAISFGSYLPAGTYTVIATNGSGCTQSMSGSAAISINSLPTAYTVTGGGSYCAGSGGSGLAIGLSNSELGVSYRLYQGGVAVGSSVSGTGSAISFGSYLPAGIYSVIATNGSGCTRTMSNSVSITINSLPTAYSVTGGGSYCAGSGGLGLAIGLSSSDLGVSYRLYQGGVAVGSSVSGTGSAISFGSYLPAGTYTVVATNGSGCTQTMSGSASIIINPLPTAYTVSSGGSYCAGGSGVLVSLSNSQTGVSYQLYLNGVALGSPLNGTGSSINFGNQTSAGTYTVIATNGSGCSQTMTGSAVISINSLPTAYTVSGSGSYCSGGSGISVSLSNSQTGISYQLYLNGVALGSPLAGSGSAISFGNQTNAGTYTVVATNGSGCSQTMTGSAVITINALPTVYSVSGGGSYCSGGSGVLVGLSNSQVGVSYQLYLNGFAVGTSVAGTGSAISFGSKTSSGTYTVVATNGSGCTQSMSGSAVITINSLPISYTVIGGGNYCSGGSGVSISLSNSQVGVSYQLYLNGVSVGTSFVGTGSSINLGNKTSAGTYTVIATNGSGCTQTMTGNAVVTINSLPTSYTVIGGGSYCVGSGGSGLAIGLSNSELGVSYRLYQDGVAVGTSVTGTGSAISFGSYLPAGTYTVIATNGSGCTQTMSNSVSITINSIPTVYTVSGSGSFCSGSTGISVNLSNSQAGVIYQLYLNGVSTSTSVAGTGSAISFGNQTIAGTYTVVAINGSGCSQAMNGSAVITKIDTPSTYFIVGGGSYCTGGSGVDVGLTGSQVGVSYQLYWDNTAIGTAIAGTGSALSFGKQTIAGTYTVVGTNALICSQNMIGNVKVTVVGTPTIFNITGGGGYCLGGSGVPIGLSNSQLGINYQLYLGGAAVGIPVSGTGAAISFGNQMVSGTYTVVASNALGCSQNMFGSTTVSIVTSPKVYNVSGGGSYCVGSSGVAIGLDGSQVGMSYQLYLGLTAVGSPITGTGSAISFGFKTVVGNYSVVATNAGSCSQNMNGIAVVTTTALPVSFNVTGGGSYCTGGSGVPVGLSGSQLGYTYQLYLWGSPVGTALNGTGFAISFGNQSIPGNYTVVATNPTSCTQTMTGSAIITIVNMPTDYNVTGGGSYCAGGSGVPIGLDGSQSGVNYQLYRGLTAVGSAITGTGSAISFGLVTTVGTYTIVATNAGTCSETMIGNAVVTTTALPGIYNVTGGGSYCIGGSGVTIGLDGSQTGISYSLYRAGVNLVTTVSGTGSAISFGAQTTAGTYTVVASNVTSCTQAMAGSTTVTVVALPTVYSVTGGGSYCSASGAVIGLNGSQVGVSYQLYQGTTAIGSVVTGTGSAISFGAQTTVGNYTVVATNSTGCTKNMTGSVDVSTSTLPSAYTVTGGGNYCAGGTGVLVGLSNSESGVNYQLYVGTISVGSAVVGTGSAISFGNQTAAGTYSVVATNSAGCSLNMSNSVIITITALPTAYLVVGGGNYCAGGNGAEVALNGSQVGVDYQLYKGTTAVGTTVAGTGSAISFGNQLAAGNYTVVASNSTGCTKDMTGSVSVAISAMPTVYTVTGGGSFYSGGSGVDVGLSNSELGVSYQLYVGTTAIGSPVSGTGSAISFGKQTTPGIYKVVATNATTCTLDMTGTVEVISVPIGNVIKTLKRSSKPVLSSDKKSFKWTYTITLVNRINQVVDSVHLRDDLDAVFKAVSPSPTYSVVAGSLRATGHLNINPNYNGSTNTDLLLDRSYLNANASDSVMIDVIVKPNGYSGVVLNTAYYDCITSIGKVKGALSDDPTLPGDHDPTPTIIKDFELFIPDGFSPNGDNTNDKFVIKHSDYLKIKIVFSNRWGNKIYSSDDYQNDWDGTGVGGNDLPTGTYYMEVFVTNRDTGEAVTSEMRYITLRR